MTRNHYYNHLKTTLVEILENIDRVITALHPIYVVIEYTIYYVRLIKTWSWVDIP